MANQRALIELEINKDSRKYSLALPMGAPLGEAYDVCHEFLREILEMGKIAAENAKKNEQAASFVKSWDDSPAIFPEIVKESNGQ